jgi:hypothetical protein
MDHFQIGYIPDVCSDCSRAPWSVRPFPGRNHEKSPYRWPCVNPLPGATTPWRRRDIWGDWRECDGTRGKWWSAWFWRGKEQKTGTCEEEQKHVVDAAQAVECPGKERRSRTNRRASVQFPTSNADGDNEYGVAKRISAENNNKVLVNCRVIAMLP